MARLGDVNAGTPPVPAGLFGTTGVGRPAPLCCPWAEAAEIKETAPLIATPFKKARRLSPPSTIVFTRVPYLPLKKSLRNLRERPTRVLRRIHHLLDFGLLHIDRKLVSQPGFRIVELDGRLIKLKAAIGGIWFSAIAQCFHFPRGEGRKTL